MCAYKIYRSLFKNSLQAKLHILKITAVYSPKNTAGKNNKASKNKLKINPNNVQTIQFIILC